MYSLDLVIKCVSQLRAIGVGPGSDCSGELPRKSQCGAQKIG